MAHPHPPGRHVRGSSSRRCGPLPGARQGAGPATGRDVRMAGLRAGVAVQPAVRLPHEAGPRAPGPLARMTGTSRPTYPGSGNIRKYAGPDLPTIPVTVGSASDGPEKGERHATEERGSPGQTTGWQATGRERPLRRPGGGPPAGSDPATANSRRVARRFLPLPPVGEPHRRRQRNVVAQPGAPNCAGIDEGAGAPPRNPKRG
jgi:hypothetical protein